MPTLYLTPSHGTSLDHIRASLTRIKQDNPLAPITFLLPNAEAVSHLQARLGSTFNAYFYQYYSLGHAILSAAGSPIREVNETTSRRLIHRLLGEMEAQGELSTFGSVWEKPGFNQVLLAWLREMKSQGIFPEDYESHALSTGLARDQQLALLYTRYQVFLQERELADADGVLWLAAEALVSDPTLFASRGALIVFGFDQFNPLQRQILTLLAARFADTSIYLLWDPARSVDSLALTRLAATRGELKASFPLEERVLSAETRIPPLLSHLRRTLFEPDVPKIVAHASGIITASEAPSREAEVRRALRAVKRLRVNGVSTDEIAVLAPGPETYLALVRTVAHEYGLPLRDEVRLGNNPAVAAFLNAVSLAPAFPWRETFDALRSPYLRQSWISDEQLAQLDQLTRERPVTASKEQWHFALQPMTGADLGVEDDDFGPPPLAAALPPEELTALEAALIAFFDHLTPPPAATHQEYTRWVTQNIFGLFEEEMPGEEMESLHLYACAEEGPYAARDQAALAEVIRILEALHAAVEIVPLNEDRRVPWEAYRSDLLNLLPKAGFTQDAQENRVFFGGLSAARARVTPHLFILGLSEGEFPKPPDPDPLYSLEERAASPSFLRQIDPAEDASLWWQVLASATQTLTLLRPYLDDNGAPWEPSPYWEAALETLGQPEVEKLPIAVRPSLEEAASASELLLALVAAGAEATPPELSEAWNAAFQARTVMDVRKSWGPTGEFEGVFKDPRLLIEIDHRYGAGYVWSASRLNSYNLCPTGFFARTVLKLEPRPDPEEGLNPLQRGGLLHAILEDFHGRLQKVGLILSSQEVNAALALLEKACEYAFSTALLRYGFRPGALWQFEQAELLRMLRALIRGEAETSDPAAPFAPFLQEAKFGIGRGSRPLHIETEMGEIHVHGVIDRLDKDSHGNLRVVDYKSGSTTYSHPDIAKGLALQTALYAQAASRWLEGEEQVLESYYLHLPKRAPSGRLAFSGTPTTISKSVETLTAAVEKAVWTGQQVRSGRFPGAAGKPAEGGAACRKGCEFAHFCRLSRLGRGKARREE